ncbi:MAG: response regulator [Pseudomonadota bacterium]
MARIMVVDDDQATLHVMAQALAQRGDHEVLSFQDAAAALQSLDASRVIDILITDIDMPEVSGRALAEAARASNGELKVLFVSGYAEALAKAQAEAGASGSVHVLSKPFTLPALQDAMAQVGIA